MDAGTHGHALSLFDSQKASIPGSNQNSSKTSLYTVSGLQPSFGEHFSSNREVPIDLRESSGNLWEPSGDLWEAPGDLWEVSGDLWEVSGDLWEVSGDLWEVSGDLWEVSGDLWEVSGDLWEVSGDLWEVSGDLWEVSGDLREAPIGSWEWENACENGPLQPRRHPTGKTSLLDTADTAALDAD